MSGAIHLTFSAMKTFGLRMMPDFLVQDVSSLSAKQGIYPDQTV